MKLGHTCGEGEGAPATRALFEGGKHLMHEREEHGHQHSRDHESSGFRPAILSDRTKSIRGKSDPNVPD